MTERLGFVGLTHVDFGLDRILDCSPPEVVERVVLARGLSCSDNEGFLVMGSSEVDSEMLLLLQ